MLYPASNIPYVDKEETAKVYKIPKLKSEINKPEPKGITRKPSKEKIKVITGPRKNKIILACVGAIYSFKINLSASAKACKRP